jgi:sortase (surface protein transpeptidase)
VDARSASAEGGVDSRAQTERLLPVPPGSEAFEERAGLKSRPVRAPKERQNTRASGVWKNPKPLRIQMPAPVSIDIPAIGVSAPVIPLGLNADRTLQVPEDFGDAGWFTRGPEPGEPGAAVVVGHVDSQSGPAVFYRLRALRPGDVIKIQLRDRSTVRYVVTSRLAAPKNRFPTKLVYAQTKRPTLRLVTCDGQFDSSTGHYVDNYIVFATIAGQRTPS